MLAVCGRAERRSYAAKCRRRTQMMTLTNDDTSPSATLGILGIPRVASQSSKTISGAGCVDMCDCRRGGAMARSRPGSAAPKKLSLAAAGGSSSGALRIREKAHLGADGYSSTLKFLTADTRATVYEAGRREPAQTGAQPTVEAPMLREQPELATYIHTASSQPRRATEAQQKPQRRRPHRTHRENTRHPRVVRPRSRPEGSKEPWAGELTTSNG